MDTKELLARVKADNIKFISYQFTDVIGAVKSWMLPSTSSKLPSRMVSGLMAHRWKASPASRKATCAWSSTRIPMPSCPGHRPMPAGRASFVTSTRPDDKPFEGDPRGVLKTSLARVAEKGWIYNVGPEPEFFLFRRNGSEGIHPVPHDVGGYFDFSADDEAVRVRAALMDALRSNGFGGRSRTSRSGTAVNMKSISALPMPCAPRITS